MSQDLKRLGQIFRSKREEMSLSLKEVENVTSIRMMYLQAIEEGRPGECLSPVYALGFIRQYATFLGFEINQMMKEFPGAFKIRKEKQQFDFGIGTLERRGSSSGHGKGLSNITWGAIAVVILVVAWYFAKFVGIL